MSDIGYRPSVIPGQPKRPLRVPQQGGGDLPGPDEAFIPNPSAGRDLLTMREAIDCINHLSGCLLADERIRRAAGG